MIQSGKVAEVESSSTLGNRPWPLIRHQKLDEWTLPNALQTIESWRSSKLKRSKSSDFSIETSFWIDDHTFESLPLQVTENDRQNALRTISHDRARYEYLVSLQNELDSFRCSGIKRFRNQGSSDKRLEASLTCSEIDSFVKKFQLQEHDSCYGTVYNASARGISLRRTHSSGRLTYIG